MNNIIHVSSGNDEESGYSHELDLNITISYQSPVSYQEEVG